MKINTGILKGRKLKTPKGLDTRPTSGITRESIFNILKDKINNSLILDLYSGSGSFGIEALSRGAGFCIFVENNKDPLECLKFNIKNFDLEKSSKILKKNLPEDINTLFSDKNFDLVFLDPPYSKGLVNQTLKNLKSARFINEKTTIIVEHSKKETPDPSIFKLIDTRKYGKSLVSFLNSMI
ncbi:MAG: 16S rRNA (guanine(966)-N(2))-methyltransferase RsmD [Desulforegulaceae bacterium]|nr:16S rRNA (guanine(966)-N(2))-methyltransferase RsmD [Desulforegulaceae bacterium]